MSIHTLSVSGLRCAHCVQLLERNLRRVPGVRRVAVRPDREEVEVDADPRFVRDSILEAAVRDSGLHVQRGARRSLFDLEVPGELDAVGPGGGGLDPGDHGHGSGGHGPGGLDLDDLDLGELDSGESERGGG